MLCVYMGGSSRDCLSARVRARLSQVSDACGGGCVGWKVKGMCAVAGILMKSTHVTAFGLLFS